MQMHISSGGTRSDSSNKVATGEEISVKYFLAFFLFCALHPDAEISLRPSWPVLFANRNGRVVNCT